MACENDIHNALVSIHKPTHDGLELGLVDDEPVERLHLEQFGHKFSGNNVHDLEVASKDYKLLQVHFPSLVLDLIKGCRLRYHIPPFAPETEQLPQLFLSLLSFGFGDDNHCLFVCLLVLVLVVLGTVSL